MTERSWNWGVCLWLVRGRLRESVIEEKEGWQTAAALRWFSNFKADTHPLGSSMKRKFCFTRPGVGPGILHDWVPRWCHAPGLQTILWITTITERGQGSSLYLRNGASSCFAMLKLEVCMSPWFFLQSRIFHDPCNAGYNLRVTPL